MTFKRTVTALVATVAAFASVAASAGATSPPKLLKPTIILKHPKLPAGLAFTRHGFGPIIAHKAGGFGPRYGEGWAFYDDAYQPRKSSGGEIGNVILDMGVPSIGRVGIAQQYWNGSTWVYFTGWSWTPMESGPGTIGEGALYFPPGGIWVRDVAYAQASTNGNTFYSNVVAGPPLCYC